MLLVLLQNAWMRGARPGQTEFWPADRPKPEGFDTRRFWQQSLWRSQTGKRLREMLPFTEWDHVYVGNASPLVGATSKAKFPFDASHVAGIIERVTPSLALLCGSEASKAAHLFAGLEIPVVQAPHPAWRLLSKEATAAVHSAIAGFLEAGGLISPRPTSLAHLGVEHASPGNRRWV